MKHRRRELIYKEESYRIIGSMFSVYNILGHGFKEKIYQRAIAEKFKEEKIPFKEQVRAKLRYKGKVIGYLILDFLVYDKIIVEIKQRDYYSKNDINQIYSYLKATGLKLGILIHFTRTGIRHKRILNLE